MVAMGRPESRVLRDGWTAVTRDGSLAAHFEHTVAVTADGPVILTPWPGSESGWRAPAPGPEAGATR
jgi:methionyl aminopeptidase